MSRKYVCPLAPSAFLTVAEMRMLPTPPTGSSGVCSFFLHDAAASVRAAVAMISQILLLFMVPNY